MYEQVPRRTMGLKVALKGNGGMRPDVRVGRFGTVDIMLISAWLFEPRW